jgi:cytochrome P450
MGLKYNLTKCLGIFMDEKNSKISFKEVMHGLLVDPDNLVRLLQKHDDIITFESILITGYLFTNPIHIRHLVSNQTVYTKSHFSKKILRNYLGDYALPSVLDEDIWEKDKGVLKNLFTKDKLAEYVPTMRSIIDASYRQWETIAKSGTPIAIEENLTETFLTIILNTLLGGVKVNIKPISYLVRNLKNLCSPRVFPYVQLWKIPMPLYFKYKKLLNALRDIAEDIVKQTFNVDKENIVLPLAKAYGFHTYEQLDKPMKEHLISQVTSMLIGGHENSVIVVMNVIATLSTNPLIEEKVKNEVTSVLSNHELNYDTLANLPYLRAVIKETLRLWPTTVAIDREPLQDDNFAGKQIKKNNLVIVPSYALQRHPKYWPDPLQFDPSRFLKPLTDDQQTLFIPFGLGRHGCIGSQFAIVEIMLIVAMLVQRYHLEMMPGYSLNRGVRNIMLRLDPKITYRIHAI